MLLLHPLLYLLLSLGTIATLHSVDLFNRKKSEQDKPNNDNASIKKSLSEIQTYLQKLRAIVAGALEDNTFSQKDVDTSLKQIQLQKQALPELLDDKDPIIKEKVTIISFLAQALIEELAVLDFWIQPYEAYERDLLDNLKKLPNAGIVIKPDPKKLYEELGLQAGQGQKLSFNGIRQKYQQRYDALQKKDPANFDAVYFRPYLRALDYVFKTPYSKAQYDAYLAGKGVYSKKSQALKPYAPTIQRLYDVDTPELKIMAKTLEAARA